MYSDEEYGILLKFIFQDRKHNLLKMLKISIVSAEFRLMDIFIIESRKFLYKFNKVTNERNTLDTK